jgi:four helix bundle protein
MGIVEEECDETLYWLEMLVELQLINADRSNELRAEGNEILALVVASVRTARGNAKQRGNYTDRA